MPRSRVIKHEFFLDESLAQQTPYGRLLFVGLWVLADREGLLEDRPSRIKAQLFPYEDIDVHHYLNELSCGWILRYEVDGKKYIQIKNFTKHQKIHPKEHRSVFPGPAGKFQNEPGNSRTSRVISPCSTSTSTSTSGDDDHSRQVKTDKLLGMPYTADFLRFWDSYPVQIGKGAAGAVWNELNPSVELFAVIMAAVAEQKKSERWKKGFVKNPADWLRERRWEDKLESSGENDGLISAADYLKQRDGK